MKSWKRLRANLAIDFPVTKKLLLRFSVMYFVLSVLMFVGVFDLSTRMVSKPLYMIPYFLVLIVFSVAVFYVQYDFQRKYSALKNIPIPAEKFGKVLLTVIKVYLTQFLLYFVIAFLAMMALVIPFSLIKRTEFSTQYVSVLTALLVLFAFFWFYRLVFVGYVAIYKRHTVKSRDIVLESKYLVRQNIGIVLVWIALVVLCMIPQLRQSLRSPGVVSPNYFVSALSILIGVVSSYALQVITVNAICEHRYLFLVEEKN